MTHTTSEVIWEYDDYPATIEVAGVGVDIEIPVYVTQEVELKDHFSAASCVEAYDSLALLLEMDNDEVFNYAITALDLTEERMTTLLERIERM